MPPVSESYDAKRCSKSGKLKTLCACEVCTVTPEAQQAADAAWAEEQRATRQRELETFRSSGGSMPGVPSPPRRCALAASWEQRVSSSSSPPKPPVPAVGGGSGRIIAPVGSADKAVDTMEEEDKEEQENEDDEEVVDADEFQLDDSIELDAVIELGQSLPSESRSLGVSLGALPGLNSSLPSQSQSVGLDESLPASQAAPPQAIEGPPEPLELAVARRVERRPVSPASLPCSPARRVGLGQSLGLGSTIGSSDWASEWEEAGEGRSGGGSPMWSMEGSSFLGAVGNGFAGGRGLAGGATAGVPSTAPITDSQAGSGGGCGGGGGGVDHRSGQLWLQLQAAQRERREEVERRGEVEADCRRDCHRDCHRDCLRDYR